MRPINDIIIHCAATRPSMDVVSINGRKNFSLVCERCNNPFLRQARIYNKCAKKNQCSGCQKAPETANNPCNGCGKLVWRGSKNCRSCARRKPRPYCVDCGKQLKGGRVRCLPCHNLKQNKGRSRERTLFNVSDEWKAVRSDCFKRDGYSCQICRKIGGYNHAHHIFPYAQYPEHRLRLDNLVTLCVGCHKFVHRIMGNSR